MDYLVGRLEATTANWSFAAPKKSLAPAAFMAEYNQPQPVKRIPRQVIADNIRTFLDTRLSEQQKAAS